MSEKKYQVFISSTFADLKEERRKILDVLLMADCIPAGMEAFVASDIEQFEVIKRVIDLCDYYVLIIGKRYGSIHPVTGKSYTEMEYDYAKEKGIPVLVFVLDESVELPEDKCETDLDKITALEVFRKKAMNNRLASIWKSIDDLTGQVAISIMRAKNEIQRPGWQRATEYDEASLRREIMEKDTLIKKLEEQVNYCKEQISELTYIPDLAFEELKITVPYKKKIYTTHGSYETPQNITTNLPALFCIIATQMLNVMISEDSIEHSIREVLAGDAAYNYTLTNTQFIKKLMLQLEALKLVYSKWSDSKKTLFWGLTKKGELERNKRLLVTKHQSE